MYPTPLSTGSFAALPEATPLPAPKASAAGMASHAISMQSGAPEFDAVCRAIPNGQLHHHLSGPLLEQHLGAPNGGPRHPLPDTTRQELQRSCNAAVQGLRLHAAFRVRGQAATISAALMLDMSRVLRMELDAPALKILADRIHAEFDQSGPDWSRITLKAGTTEPLLARQLEHSRSASEKPPVRFAVEVVRGRLPS